MRKRFVVLLLIQILFICCFIQSSSSSQITRNYTDIDEAVMIGNPAATYCQTIMGYDYQIVQDDAGGLNGVCQMPNGSFCDQWDFYAGTCGIEYSYCEQNDMNLIAMTDGNNPFSTEYSVCVDPLSRTVLQISDLILESSTCSAQIDSPNFISSQTFAPDIPLDTFPESEQSPSAIDWRDYNGQDWLTSVKNQSTCGACWAFAAAGAVESSENIWENDPTIDLDLSEENMVRDCPDYIMFDCSGGIATSAMMIMRSYGVVDEACMPYTSSNGNCASICGDWESRLYYAHNVVSETSPDLTTDLLKEFVSRHGPVAVSMNAAGSFDQDSIYRCSDDTSTNHAVVVVGYDDIGEYWIVKNSWGTSYQDGGYFKVGYGECAIDYKRAAFVDTKAPESNATPNGTTGDNDWYTSDISVTLSATDLYGSGVKSVEYQINGDTWTRIYNSEAVVNLSTDGSFDISFLATDNGGKTEKANAITLKRDATPPQNPDNTIETSCGATSGVGLEECTDPSFTWTGASDPTSNVAGYGIYFGEDETGTDPSSYSPNPNYSPGSIPEGKYYLRIRTKDNAGNWSEWTTAFELITGIQPPESSHTLYGTLGDNGWYITQVSVEINSIDYSGTGIDYIEHKINSGDWLQNPGDYAYLTLTSDGHYNFYYRAMDNQGSLESENFIEINIDMTDPLNPTSVIDSNCGSLNGVTQFECNHPIFSWTPGVDSTSGVVQYNVYFGTNQNGTSSTYSSETSYDPGSLTEGIYYLRLRTQDNAGNWSVWQTKYIFDYRDVFSTYIPLILLNGN